MHNWLNMKAYEQAKFKPNIYFNSHYLPNFFLVVGVGEFRRS